jgi:hypothetical protein
MDPYYILFLIILGAVLFIEGIVYLILIKGKKSEILLSCLLINLFTLPLANFIVFSYGFFWLFLVIIEIVVFIIECVLLKLLLNLSWKRAALVSFVANLITGAASMFYFFI